MNSKERLDRCYRLKETDRPAIYTRTGYPQNDPSYTKLVEYMNRYSDLKTSWRGAGIEQPCRQSVSKEAYSSDYQRVIRTIHTPTGDIVSTYFEGLTGKPGLTERHFLEDRSAFEKYLSLPEPEAFVREPSGFQQMVKKMGERGIVEVSLGMNPAGFVADLAGSLSFAMMSVTDRDILHALCERRQKVMIELVDRLIQEGIGPYFSMLGQEYIVPPMHGVDDFYDFNVRYDKPIIDRIREAGGLVHVHSHGSIKTVLQGFIDMGADVLHPFEAPPMGDITAKEAKQAIRGKMCMEGNIEIGLMYTCTSEEIEQRTKDLIKDAFDDGKGLIVCPTASPFIFGQGDVCFENYRAMTKAVLSYEQM